MAPAPIQPSSVSAPQPVIPPVDSSPANVSAEQPVFDTNHPRPNTGNGSASTGQGVLSKLKPTKSQNNVKATSAGEGPSVTSETAPLVSHGKDTRFSDTTHISRPATPVIEEDPETPAVVHNVPDVVDPKATPNKLKKGKPVHDAAVTGGTPVVLVPSGEAVTAGTSNGGPAIVGVPGLSAPVGLLPHGGNGAAASGSSTVPPRVELEEFVLPDGRTGFVPKDAGGKKGKSTEKVKTSENVTAAVPPPPVVNESAMGHGHCSVCCPSAPKTAHGVPIEACAHQEGPIGPAIPVKPSDDTKGKKKAVPPVAPPTGLDIPEIPAPATEITETENVSKPDGTNKLKKKTTAGPAAPPMSSEEQALEDAKSLAGGSDSSLSISS